MVPLHSYTQLHTAVKLSGPTPRSQSQVTSGPHKWHLGTSALVGCLLIFPMYQGKNGITMDYYDFRIGTGCHQNHHASQWAPSLHIAGTVSSLAFSSGATGNHLVKPRPQHFTSHAVWMLRLEDSPCCQKKVKFKWVWVKDRQPQELHGLLFTS